MKIEILRQGDVKIEGYSWSLQQGYLYVSLTTNLKYPEVQPHTVYSEDVHVCLFLMGSEKYYYYDNTDIEFVPETDEERALIEHGWMLLVQNNYGPSYVFLNQVDYGVNWNEKYLGKE